MDALQRPVLIYDGSFEGFLSLIFSAFERRLQPSAILALAAIDQPGLQLPLIESMAVDTEKQKSDRVFRGICRKSSPENARMLQTAFRAGYRQADMQLFRYIFRLFTEQSPFWQNQLDADVFAINQLARRVRREVHRFQGFVRFQQTGDGMGFAPIDPDHDILPLLAPFFRRRFPLQSWVIYDSRRQYGIFWDQKQLQEVSLQCSDFHAKSGKLAEAVCDREEHYYARLWKTYYDAVNISQRANPGQMLRAMPRRYWKYLPEKQP